MGRKAGPHIHQRLTWTGGVGTQESSRKEISVVFQVTRITCSSMQNSRGAQQAQHHDSTPKTCCLEPAKIGALTRTGCYAVASPMSYHNGVRHRCCLRVLASCTGQERGSVDKHTNMRVTNATSACCKYIWSHHANHTIDLAWDDGRCSSFSQDQSQNIPPSRTALIAVNGAHASGNEA